MAYPPEFLKLVDEFIHLANRLAEDVDDGEVSAAILFAAGRYNAFNFVSHNGTEEDKERAVDVLCLGVPQGAGLQHGRCCRAGGQAPWVDAGADLPRLHSGGFAGLRVDPVAATVNQ